MSNHIGLTGYVNPWDAGLASTPEATGKRIAKLLDALCDNINRWIVSGPIEQDCWEFKSQLIDKLTADGWQVKINRRDKYTVKPTKAYWESLR